MSSSTSDFITRARNLMDLTVKIANEMGAIQTELKYSDIASKLEADETGENAGITPEAVLQALGALGETIGGMSDEGKKAIYAIKH